MKTFHVVRVFFWKKNIKLSIFLLIISSCCFLILISEIDIESFCDILLKMNELADFNIYLFMKNSNFVLSKNIFVFWHHSFWTHFSLIFNKFTKRYYYNLLWFFTCKSDFISLKVFSIDSKIYWLEKIFLKF
jgi:hypothetical protein